VSETTVHLTGSGPCTVTASQGAATPVARTFTIAKVSQTITFGALSNRTVGDDFGRPEAGCPSPRNASFQLAAKADARATTLNRQFVARFNPLAGAYHRATWKAAKI
jgi:hypothetical protein